MNLPQIVEECVATAGRLAVASSSASSKEETAAEGRKGVVFARRSHHALRAMCNVSASLQLLPLLLRCIRGWCCIYFMALYCCTAMWRGVVWCGCGVFQFRRIGVLGCAVCLCYSGENVIHMMYLDMICMICMICQQQTGRTPSAFLFLGSRESDVLT